MHMDYNVKLHFSPAFASVAALFFFMNYPRIFAFIGLFFSVERNMCKFTRTIAIVTQTHIFILLCIQHV